MRIFISWSGARSHRAAKALSCFLTMLSDQLVPWVSSSDLASGGRWQEEVQAGLSAADFGVVCVTPENYSAPWLLFEAGALSCARESGASAHLCPVLIDMGLDILPATHPFRQFMIRSLTQADMRRLATELLNRAGDAASKERALARFDAAWKELSTLQERDIAQLTADELTFEVTELTTAMLAGQSTSFQHAVRQAVLMAAIAQKTAEQKELQQIYRLVATTPFSDLPPTLIHRVDQLNKLIAPLAMPILAARWSSPK